VNRDIIEGHAWIAYVSHDADDGAWQFHTSEIEPPREAYAALVALSEIVQRDDSVVELADLPAGWCAWRDSEDAPWQRAPMGRQH
jgi:hypothetical protein